MNNIQKSQDGHPNSHTGKNQTPRRVASRMEGVTKNIGNTNIKKSPKGE